VTIAGFIQTHKSGKKEASLGPIKRKGDSETQNSNTGDSDE